MAAPNVSHPSSGPIVRVAGRSALSARLAARRVRPLGRPLLSLPPEERLAWGGPSVDDADFDGSIDGSEDFETLEGIVEEVDEDEARVDVWGESTSGSLHLVERLREQGAVDVLGLKDKNAEDVVDIPTSELQDRVDDILAELSIPPTYPSGQPERAVFCSRMLNMRSLKAIGFDMDYTLISYDVAAWEGRAFAYGVESLSEWGFPVDGLEFDDTLVVRGLIIDKELGNILKVDRFGLVKRAMHGTKMLSPAAIRNHYGRFHVKLGNEERFVFLNTLFSVSEGALYTQLVDRFDQGLIPETTRVREYKGLYASVSKSLFRAHVEGRLKGEIIQNPHLFVRRDPEMCKTLLDMRDAGKQLLLITNSDLEYTNEMMTYAYNEYLPSNMRTWRDLFDMVITSSRKPDFFNYDMGLYEVVNEEGLMKPTFSAKAGGIYCGGSARMVEKALGLEGDDFLYVGDHIYTDVTLAKLNFKWRTCLILDELETEILALAKGRGLRRKLKNLLAKKEMLSDVFNQLRLERQRQHKGHGHDASFADEEAVNETLAQLLMIMNALDREIVPLIERDGHHFNTRWGYLSRAGVNDKSQLQRQIEKYADIYTSRVSNFLRYTPYMYFRSPSQSLAHDRNLSDFYRRQYRRDARSDSDDEGYSYSSDEDI